MSAGVDSCDRRRATAHARIQHELPFVGVGFNQILEQLDRLACRVVSLTEVPVIKREHIPRISPAVRTLGHDTPIPFRLAVTIPILVRNLCIRLPIHPLRVIRRQLPIEHENILVASHRHLPCVKESDGHRLLPHPLVAEHLAIGINDIDGEGQLRENDDRGIHLGHAVKLLPHLRHRQTFIPKIIRRSEGRVSQNHINRAIGNPFHPFNAILQENSIFKSVNQENASFTLRRANSQYSALSSNPIYFLPVNTAILAVVPAPIKGSSTKSPSSLQLMM